MKPKRSFVLSFKMPSMIARVIALVIMGGIFGTFPASADTPTVLSESRDMGCAYLDSMVFFGESTTTHLRARGGVDETQIWADQSGTRMLSAKTPSEPIVYPETGEVISIAEACRRKQPAILVLSFGLNGVTRFVHDKERYLACYAALIDTIRNASPNTRIILQTIYPVRNADRFSIDVDTLNAYIQTLNSWLPELVTDPANVRIADTASILRDNRGALCADLADADGIHLLPCAYERILFYLRTHAWQLS